ncbi:MAG TPA: hypothetical protein VMU03_13815 [Gammaproteobacteria bacterium]|jgi:hypothetical protein|nr:hypothetical protein [Gammaproteobacteria bacterium]
MKALAILYVIAAVMPWPAFADCVAPAPPGDPPSGATASREQMIAAQAAIKGYDAAVSEFATCVSKGGGGRPAQAEEAVRSVEKLAARFNAELRVFKQRNGG